MADADEFIHADVYYLLSCNLSLPRDGITARVQDGWITLLGCVDWPFQKTAAEWGLLEHSGASGIINQIAVRPNCDVDTQCSKRVQFQAA